MIDPYTDLIVRILGIASVSMMVLVMTMFYGWSEKEP